jgi:hypothetical protein
MDGSTPYGQSTFLNEIHTHFPALLYDTRRFNSVRDVFGYVEQQMSHRFDVYSNQRQAWSARHASRQRHRHQPQAPQAQQAPQPQIPRGQQPGASIVIPPLRTLDYSLDPLTRLFLATLISPAPPNFMEPIQITATPEQIAQGSVLSTAAAATDSPCAICQDTIAVGDRTRHLHGCNHIFHQTCIDTWFQRNVHCPVCRHDIRTVVAAPVPVPTAFSQSLARGLNQTH